MSLYLNGSEIRTSKKVYFNNKSMKKVHFNGVKVWENIPSGVFAAAQTRDVLSWPQYSFNASSFVAYDSNLHYYQEWVFGEFKTDGQSHDSMATSTVVIRLHYDKEYGLNALGITNKVYADTGSFYNSTGYEASRTPNPNVLGYMVGRFNFHNSYFQFGADVYIKADRL